MEKHFFKRRGTGAGLLLVGFGMAIGNQQAVIENHHIFIYAMMFSPGAIVIGAGLLVEPDIAFAGFAFRQLSKFAQMITILTAIGTIALYVAWYWYYAIYLGIR